MTAVSPVPRREILGVPEVLDRQAITLYHIWCTRAPAVQPEWCASPCADTASHRQASDAAMKVQPLGMSQRGRPATCRTHGKHVKTVTGG
jgi:hypothetical protein